MFFFIFVVRANHKIFFNGNFQIYGFFYTLDIFLCCDVVMLHCWSHFFVYFCCRTSGEFCNHHPICR